MLRSIHLIIGLALQAIVGVHASASNPLIDPFVIYRCNNDAINSFIGNLPKPTTNSIDQCTSDNLVKSHIVVCTVQISIDNQPVNVVLLSSSGAFWVASKTCSGSSCPKVSTYDSNAFKSTSTSYNTNGVHGTVSSGTVNFGRSSLRGGVNALEQPFGLITSIDSPPEVVVSPPYEGIFGFTYADGSFVNGLANPLVTLNRQGVLAACSISFAFLDKTNEPLTGYSTLNEPDPVTYIPGTFSYTPTLFPGYWLFSVDSLSVSKSIMIATSFPALLAPFLGFIYGPSSLICQLNQKIGCNGWSQGVCFVDCMRLSVLPSVILTIQGRDYIMEPNDYILSTSINTCVSVFLPDSLNSKTPDGQSFYWTLGNPFVAKYVSEFDCQNNRVGLATKNPAFELPV